MKVKDIMVKSVIVAKEDTTLESVARLLLDNGIGCVPIVDSQGELIGIITESDFAAKDVSIPFSTFQAPQILGHWVSKEGIERIYERAANVLAKEIMNQPVFTVTEEEPIEKAVELMLKHDINRLPVVRDNIPVGIISRHDLLRLVMDKRE